MDLHLPDFLRSAIRKVSRNFRHFGAHEAPFFIEPPKDHQFSYAKWNETRKQFAPEPVVGPRLGGLSILVVDDSEDSRAIVRHILTKNGAKVETANDGESAVAILRNHVYDVVLLDLDMPMLDGFEVMEELHQMHYEEPILAYTGYKYEEEATKIRNAGFWGYLGKPIQRELLLSSIEQLLWMRKRLPSEGSPRRVDLRSSSLATESPNEMPDRRSVVSDNDFLL